MQRERRLLPVAYLYFCEGEVSRLAGRDAAAQIPNVTQVAAQAGIGAAMKEDA